MAFELKVRHEPHLSFVDFLGQLTAKESHICLQELGDEMSSEAFNLKVLVDMSQVDFLDSSGIGTLLSLHKRFRETGGRMVFHSVTPTVSGLLSLLNLQKVLSISNNEQSAHQDLEEFAS